MTLFRYKKIKIDEDYVSEISHLSSRKSRWAMSKLAFFIRRTTRYPSKSTGWAWVNNFIWFMYFVSSEPSCLITGWRWMMISVERKTPCLTRAVYGLISIRKKCDESVIGIDGHTRNASTGSILNYIPVWAHYYHRLVSVQFGTWSLSKSTIILRVSDVEYKTVL